MSDEEKQGPIMVAASSDDGLYTAWSGDTLDAFGPLTQRALQSQITK